MITHLESDILECELKCALGSITTSKTSGGDKVPDELLQIFKDNTAALNMAANLENSTGHRTGNVSFYSNCTEG